MLLINVISPIESLISSLASTLVQVVPKCLHHELKCLIKLLYINTLSQLMKNNINVQSCSPF